jgi:hypothetical protein
MGRPPSWRSPFVAQQSRRVAMVLVQMRRPGGVFHGAVRKEIRAVDRNHTVTEVKTM